MNWKTISIALLVSVGYFGCSKSKSVYQKHEKLIGVQSIYVGEDPTIAERPMKVKYTEEYLTVSVWEILNACGKYDRNIQISNDTIFLSKELTSDVVCASLRVDKTTYFISNPEKWNWVIVD